MKEVLKIGTRGSKLALRQAELVISALRAHTSDLNFQIVVVKSEGDLHSDAPLSSLGVGIFTKALERSLLGGEIDLAVHSLKDLPTQPSSEFRVIPVMKREDPQDVLINRWHCSVSDLPHGARIGTSSPRREAQLKTIRPDLQFTAIRGNIETRIRKATADTNSDYDGTVLAAAGIARLGLNVNKTEKLPIEICTPSPGQGALAAEIREEDSELIDLINHLVDPPTKSAVEAERWLLKLLGGGCSLPVGAYGLVQNNSLELWANVSSIDGSNSLKAYVSKWAVDDPEGAGKEALRQLSEMGVEKLIGFEAN